MASIRYGARRHPGRQECIDPDLLRLLASLLLPADGTRQSNQLGNPWLPVPGHVEGGLFKGLLQHLAGSFLLYGSKRSAQTAAPRRNHFLGALVCSQSAPEDGP